MALTLSYLRENYAYDAERGTMIYLPCNRAVTTMDDRGRMRFSYGKRKLLLRRVAWWHFTGVQPEGEVRVVDASKPECAIDNLCLHTADGRVIRARDASLPASGDAIYKAVSDEQ